MWGDILLLIFISLMISEWCWASFNIPIGHLYGFFGGNVYLGSLTIFNWVIIDFMLLTYMSSLHFGLKLLIRYMVCRDFLPFRSLIYAVLQQCQITNFPFWRQIILRIQWCCFLCPKQLPIPFHSFRCTLIYASKHRSIISSFWSFSTLIRLEFIILYIPTELLLHISHWSVFFFVCLSLLRCKPCLVCFCVG